jgi:hypothetical protein
MKKRILWPERYYGKADPFTGATPLKITLHSDSFSNLNLEDQKSIDLLRDFSQLDQLEVFGFSQPDLLISFDRDKKATGFSLRVAQKNGSVSFQSGFDEERVNQKHIDRSTTMLNVSPVDNPQRQELMCIEAHMAIDNHLFVTASELFLNSEFESFFERANVYSPKDALKIAALLLRSKRRWLYASNYSTPSDMFYSNLLLSTIPHRQFLMSDVAIKEEISGQLISFYEKCKRCLRTKDILGSLFYRIQDYEALDEQLYYFDYFTLLLAGAFDSLAEISNILIRPKYRGQLSFRNRGREDSFVQGIKNAGADKLFDLVTSERGTKLQKMLFKLRNQIHSELSSGTTNRDFNRQSKSYIKVGKKVRDVIFDTSSFFSGQEDWGLAKRSFTISRHGGPPVSEYEIELEPYNYSTKLLDLWLVFFEEILSSLPNCIVLETNDPEKDLQETASLLG